MIWFLAAMIAMAVIEGRKLYSAEKWRELVAFGGTWVVATTYGALTIAAGARLPKLYEIVQSALKLIF